MVRPREDPWGLSPSLRPWEAWGILMDLCARFRPVGPPRSSCDAYVGRLFFFRSLTGTFDGSPPATRRRGGYSETLAGGQPGPARAAPPAAFGTATRGSGSCGGCGSGGQPQRDASLAAPWPGGSRGLPGPRPPRHLEWLPAAAAPAGAVAAAGGHNVVPTSPTTSPIEARCVPATCLRLAYTVSCVVSEGEKGRGGRGGQGGRRGTKAAGGCSATCVPQAQGPGHQGAAR